MSHKSSTSSRSTSQIIAWVALVLIVAWLGMSWSRVGQSEKTTGVSGENQEQVESTETPNAEGPRAEIVTEMLNLRANPTTDDQTVIGTLKRGQIVQVLKTEDDWLLVKLEDGKSGYIANKGDYIRLLDQ